MIAYIAKRFAALVAVAFVISVLTFLLVHLLPGDPSVTILGVNDTAANRAQLLHQLGLNKPLVDQYWIWLGHALHGNLGQSYLNHEQVTTLLAQGVPIDVELLIYSQVIAFGIAIPLAMVASRRPNRFFDRISTGATFGMLALPPFVLGPILVAIFAVGLGWFPATGTVPISQDFATNLRDMFLPALSIAAGSTAVYFRLLRSDLITTLQQDFITSARAKGLPNRRIMLRHAFRPSLFSMLAAAGVTIGSLIAGEFIVEELFALNGIGYSLVQAVLQRDYLVVQGIALVTAVAYVVLMFLVDFFFLVIDPRVARS